MAIVPCPRCAAFALIRRSGPNEGTHTYSNNIVVECVELKAALARGEQLKEDVCPVLEEAVVRWHSGRW